MRVTVPGVRGLQENADGGSPSRGRVQLDSVAGDRLQAAERQRIARRLAHDRQQLAGRRRDEVAHHDLEAPITIEVTDPRLAKTAKARVVAVIECLDKGVGVPLNAGGDSASGVPMVVLAVELRGKTVAMFDVFASAAGAATAYPAIKAHESPSVTKLVGSSVVVYMQHVSLDKQRAIEACD